MNEPISTSKLQMILEKSKQIFMTESADRIDGLHNSIQQWNNDEISMQQLASNIYSQVHAIRGVALTLGFENLHHLCSDIITATDDGAKLLWTNHEMNQLISLVDKLKNSLTLPL